MREGGRGRYRKNAFFGAFPDFVKKQIPRYNFLFFSFRIYDTMQSSV